MADYDAKGLKDQEGNGLNFTPTHFLDAQGNSHSIQVEFGKKQDTLSEEADSNDVGDATKVVIALSGSKLKTTLASKFWNYIKGKLGFSSETGKFGINISGTAAGLSMQTTASNVTYKVPVVSAAGETRWDGAPSVQNFKLNYAPDANWLNVVSASADKWRTARNFTIQDNSTAHQGPAFAVDGSANAVLTLPSSIDASVSGTSGGLNPQIMQAGETYKVPVISSSKEARWDGTPSAQNFKLNYTPDSNTINANITGNAGSATLANDYNPNTGSIKTALAGKQETLPTATVGGETVFNIKTAAASYANTAGSANTAEKAEKDTNGNFIILEYATKAELRAAVIDFYHSNFIGYSCHQPQSVLESNAETIPDNYAVQYKDGNGTCYNVPAVAPNFYEGVSTTGLVNIPLIDGSADRPWSDVFEHGGYGTVLRNLQLRKTGNIGSITGAVCFRPIVYKVADPTNAGVEPYTMLSDSVDWNLMHKSTATGKSIRGSSKPVNGHELSVKITGSSTSSAFGFGSVDDVGVNGVFVKFENGIIKFSVDSNYDFGNFVRGKFYGFNVLLNF